MTEIKKGINRLYLDLLQVLKEEGDIVGPRSLRTKELCNITLRLDDARECVITLAERKLNYPFMVAEWLWMWTGRNDVEMISSYCSKIAQFSDDGETFFGAYGPPLLSQLPYIYKALSKDLYTRQAVLTIWRQAPQVSKDIPCTALMQFLYRGGKLNLSVFMRSSDAWLGIPYDLFNFSMILQGVAAEVNDRCLGKQLVEPGSLTLHIGSSHLYQTDWDAANGLTLYYGNHDEPSISMPKLETYGYFSLKYREERLRTLHQNTDPEFFSGSRLYNQLLTVLHYRFHRQVELITNEEWRDVIAKARIA